MLNQINIDVFNSINHFAGSNVLLDNTAILIANYLPIFFILVLIYLWFRKTEVRNLVLFSIYASILGLALNYLISLFYFHPRPFMDKIGILLIKHACDTSFPSDHTTFMLSIAFMFLYFKKTRATGLILSILGLIGGISRIFTGLHYPLDIIGSLLVAIIATSIIFYMKTKLIKINKIILSIYYKFIK